MKSEELASLVLLNTKKTFNCLITVVLILVVTISTNLYQHFYILCNTWWLDTNCVPHAILTLNKFVMKVQIPIFAVQNSTN